MSDKRAQPGKYGQERCQTIGETDRDSAADGNQAMSPCSPERLWCEGVPLPVNVVCVCDGRMFDDRAEAACRGNGQIVAPREGRNLLPFNELPLGLETLALASVHRRLPPDVHPRPLGTVQAASCERQSEGEQAQRECPEQPSSGHRSARTQRSIQPTCRWLDRDLVSAIMVMTGE